MAKAKEPILISGPTGSGKKRIIQFLVENGPLNQHPFFILNGLTLTEDLWDQARGILQTRGTLIIEELHYLPLPFQAKFKDWLAGKRPLFNEPLETSSSWRIICTSSSSQTIWDDLVYDFPYRLQLPSLNEVVEDIPYHLRYFLQGKSIRYLRYFFLLKTFFHQWPGNLRELEHYLTQAMAYYSSKSIQKAFPREEEVFGETTLRYYQDILKGEWWYYPYRFLPNFSDHLAEILTKTDFRFKIMDEKLVSPLIMDEPGFLVFDLAEPEFEQKANRMYTLFSDYLKITDIIKPEEH